MPPKSAELCPPRESDPVNRKDVIMCQGKILVAHRMLILGEGMEQQGPMHRTEGKKRVKLSIDFG